MLSITRQERLQAANAWDNAFSPRYSQAVAQTLVDVVSSLEDPTVADLLSFLGEGGYDLDDHFRVDVPVASLVGLPGDGPTVADLVAALEDLEPAELDIAIGQRLADLLE